MLNPFLRVRGTHLFVQALESRLMLSVSPISETVTLERIDASHEDASVGAFLYDDAWILLNQDAAFDALATNAADSPTPTHHDAPRPIPAIPFDDSLDPLNECPDVGDEFCLPGDASQDGTVDFLDFLLLNQNYGAENATWEDGDFDGDGRVGFADLLILSSNFGVVG